jgi:hypothetical protein
MSAQACACTMADARRRALDPGQAIAIFPLE